METSAEKPEARVAAGSLRRFGSEDESPDYGVCRSRHLELLQRPRGKEWDTVPDAAQSGTPGGNGA